MNDLLSAPADNDNMVSLHYVLGALRRKRRVLAGLGVAGLCLGLLLSVALPKPRSATTEVLLQFPAGADTTRAITTDVSLLETRGVAEAALKSLGLHESVTSFQSTYAGTTLSDSVLRITVKAPSASEAVRRSNALSRSFLGFRKQVYDYQLSVAVGVLSKREAVLKNEVASVSDQIARLDPASAASNGSPLSELLSQRSGALADIAQIESQIGSNTIATATVVDGSRVIDPGHAAPQALRRAALVNAASGLVAALAIGVIAITLLAVVTTRLRRRADVAAALRAPVLLSVGRVLPPAWTRLVRSATTRLPASWKPRARTLSTRLPRGWMHRVRSWNHPEEPSEELTLVVRHLQSLLTLASPKPPALVVVAVDDIDVAAVTVRALAHRLAEEGQQGVVVNATGRTLPPAVSPPEEAAVDPARSPESDVVVVVAALDPAKGAEHLREWASDAVVFVSAGRSTATTLESNAAMIRGSGLHLRSVVLVGCDPDDDSLGAFDTGSAAPAKPRATRTPRKSTKARST